MQITLFPWYLKAIISSFSYIRLKCFTKADPHFLLISQTPAHGCIYTEIHKKIHEMWSFENY